MRKRIMNRPLSLLIVALTLTAAVLTVQSYVIQRVVTPRTTTKELGMYRDTTVCGDDLCLCSGDVADCSGHTGGLQYIPRLPSTIRGLNFSSNHLEGIYQDDFFENVTNLQNLSLYQNGVKFITPGAFRRLSQLRVLNMDFSPVNYSSLSTLLSISTLTDLSVTGCDLGRVPEGFFNTANLPELSTLLVYDNHIGDTRLSTFGRLTGLTILGLASNKISHLDVDLVTGLEILNMNSNALFVFPTSCYNGNSSLFPGLTHMLLRTNLIASVGRVCLPKLQVLLLSENKFDLLPSNAFGRLPSLIELYVYAMNSHIDTLKADAFSNPSLQRISLAYNSIDFNQESINDKCFANCLSLSELQLSHNFLSIPEERFSRLFSHLVKLRYLYMEECEISVLTSRMFAHFPLLERLALDCNSLVGIPDGAFDGLKKLTSLQLDSNQIRVVPATLFSADTRQRLTSLDLSGNPLTCSCDVLWFQGWFLSRPSLFSRSWGNYTCFNVPGEDVGSFYLDSQACLLSRGAAVMVVVSVSLVLLVLTLVVAVFRYRWHLRLLLHEVFRGVGETRRRHLETGRFQYDLFVSYDSDNLPWVVRHLVPQLEDSRGLRLCLRDRDFPVGGLILDNIAEYVESSKKVLMLFSDSFVQNQWCQFELSFCLRHVMAFDDALVIVCLDDVPSRDLTTAMMAVLKTTTYIQWVDDDDDAMTSFWGRLDVALQEIYPRRAVE